MQSCNINKQHECTYAVTQNICFDTNVEDGRWAIMDKC